MISGEKTAHRNPALKSLVIVLIAAHLCLSMRYITEWLFQYILKSYLVYYNVPVENRLFTMSPQEYKHILEVRQSIPEDANIFWVPKVSCLVNYYIYPRRIFYIPGFKQEELRNLPPDFFKSRNIKYIFFDYDKMYPVVYNDNLPVTAQ